MKRQAILIALAALVISALPVYAQLSALATVHGKVTGMQNEPMSGMQIEIVNNDNGRRYNATTNAQGEYQIAAVVPGNYTLSLLKDGKLVLKEPQVAVQPDNNGMVPHDIPLAKIAAEAETGGKAPSAEQQKKIEEIKKKNAEIEAYNTKVREVKPLLDQADAAEKTGNMDQAVTLLTQASQSAGPQPEFSVVWFKLGDALVKDKKYADAVPALQKAVAMKPNDSGYHIVLGDALKRAGKPEDAVKEFQAAAQMNDANAAIAYFDMGAALTEAAYRQTTDDARMKMINDANTAFDNAIAKNPNYADAYYQKGVNLLGKATTDKSGKVKAPDGTAEALNKYLELQPDGPHAAEAKNMLAMLGESVQTTYRKGKK